MAPNAKRWVRDQAFGGNLPMPIKDAFEMFVKIFHRNGAQLVKDATDFHPIIGVGRVSILSMKNKVAYHVVLTDKYGIEWMLTYDKKKFTLKREEREVVNERIFDAPCELVWKVYTDPELVLKWWGPKYLTTTVDKMDVRVGGVWRFVQRDQDGKEYAFNGDYREIVPHERLVYTFEFEGMPGHVLIETITFEELDGKTKMTDTAHYQTIEDLDGMLESGMEEGATETMDRLAELVEKSQEKYMNPSELIDKHIAELADAGYADHPFAHRTFQTASSIYLYFKQPSDNMRN